MSRLSNSPRLQKGALISIDVMDPTPNVIAFQYNPETMTRSLTPKTSGEGGSKKEVLRIESPPAEKISLKAEFDATDGLETREPIAVSMGVYPQISALERMLYPSSEHVIANLDLTARGVIEIIPPIAPMILFVWGPNRVLPVQIESMSIEEAAYDERLNPILARVDLGLRVLSYADLPLLHPGTYHFLVHQVAKEAMANLAITNNNPYTL